MSWSGKYKRSIDCDNPKGFSQRAHCQARNKRRAGEETKSKSPFNEDVKDVKFTKFSHKTKHLKGIQHQLDPNVDTKQLVHHATMQYVDLDADGDVDVFDKKTPDENPQANFDKVSKQLMKKQKGELKHTRRGVAFEGNLHQWFKGSKSKDGKPGWVNVVTGGTCASDEPGEGVPKCVSSEKRASMTKAERLSASRRKKKADKGQQQKSGAAKPTYVSTDKPKKKMNEAKDHEYSMARSELSTIMSAARRLKSKMGKGEGNIEAWVQSKITKAADYLDSAADYVDSGEMNKEGVACPVCGHDPCQCLEGSINEAKDKKGEGSGSKDACYNKVKSRYDVWPSAYASGALVKCRKVGAANWGNKKEGFEFEFNQDYHKSLVEKCWAGYAQKGMKKKGDKMVPNCVPEQVDASKYGKTPDQLLQDIVDKKKLGGQVVKSGLKNAKEEVEIQEKVERYNELGQTVAVTLRFRGKIFYLQLFFPTVKFPNRKEVETQVQKIYPDAVVMMAVPATVDPTKPTIRVAEGKEFRVGDTIPASATKPKPKPTGASKYKFSVDKTGLKGPEKPLKTEEVLQEKPGDGYLGPTPIPNPIRMAQDAVDSTNRANQRKVNRVNDILGHNAASMPKHKYFNKDTSPAYKRYFGGGVQEEVLPDGPAADKRNPQKPKRKTQGGDVRAGLKEASPIGYNKGNKDEINRSGPAEVDKTRKELDAIRKSIPVQKAHFEPEGEMVEGAAWTKKSGKNPEGGLNEKGRKSYERENPGSDLKAPSKKVGNKRRASFCARMKGMKNKLTSAKTANDPDSRINKSLRAWNC